MLLVSQGGEKGKESAKLYSSENKHPGFLGNLLDGSQVPPHLTVCADCFAHPLDFRFYWDYVAGRWWERERPCVFDCLRLSKAVRASGLELMLSVFSGGSVEVYNCATGSADCSQCLGREDLGHRCLWSESSSSCRLHTEPPQVSEACPPPEIRKVRPEGNVEGVHGVV